MNYPLISEYIEAIKSAEDNFEELSYLRPVLGDDELPIMTSGNFAVVFKMKDEQSGKFYAVKCFTKEQEGRAEAYREIVKELEDVSSPYLVSIQYLEKELFVDTDQTTETEFPVLLMDWVEGKTLDKYIRENLNQKRKTEALLRSLFQLVEWLIAQPFAHGDLKPENILVSEEGALVLVDYDGMYVPAMKGQKAREVGSPDFCHPQRNEDYFNEHMDDFSLLSILLSLCIVYIKANFIAKYGAEDRLLFSKSDYINIHKSKVFNDIPSIIETSTNYKSLFENACINLHFRLNKGMLTPIDKLISIMAIQKQKLNDILDSRIVNDIENLHPEIDAFNTYWGIPNKQKQQYVADKATFHQEPRECKKSNNSTKWSTVLVIQILGTLFLILDLYFCNENNLSFSAFILRPIIIFSSICCGIYMCFYLYKEWKK